MEVGGGWKMGDVVGNGCVSRKNLIQRYSKLEGTCISSHFFLDLGRTFLNGHWIRRVLSGKLT